jgi:hypothetical protein
MPVMECEKDGKMGHKWGENGVCFTGEDSKKKAAKVGRAIHAKQNEMLFELQENKSKRVQVAKVGTFEHEIYGTFSIKAPDLQEMKVNFDANARRQKLEGNPVLPFDYKHEEEDKAAGWIKSLKIGKDTNGAEALFAEVDSKPNAAEKIRGNEFKFVSPSIRRNYKDAETGKKFNIILKGATLTNVPFLRDMEAVHLLSEDKRKAFESLKLSGDTDFNIQLGANMPELIKKFQSISPEEQDNFLAECGLIRKDKKLSEELEKAKKDLKKTQDDLKLSEKELEELKESSGDAGDLEERLKLSEGEAKKTKEQLASVVKKLAEQEQTSKFNEMLSEGKVCEAQREAYMEGDMEEFAAKAEEFKLDESGQNSKGDETSDVEEQILKLTEKKAKDEKMEYGDAMSLVLEENPKLAAAANQNQ